jgi:hypothetical protein
VKRRKVIISTFAEDETECVTFYSIKLDSDLDSQTDQFVEKFGKKEYKHQLDIILTAIELISCSGAAERHFRPAEKKADNVMELPGKKDKCLLRLYCLRLSENVVVLGSGDVKETRTYNEDPNLDQHVKRLAAIDKLIKQRILNKQITIEGKELNGNLIFEIPWDLNS